MAPRLPNKPPPEDPRVTDLRRYKKAREQAKRRPPPKPPGQGLLGSNPRAGLILAILVVVAAVLWLGPVIMKLL
jgi:hypothetical protein